VVDVAMLPCITYKGAGARAGGAASHSVELLASLVLLDFRLEDVEADSQAQGFAGAIVGQTDSMGSMFAVAKLYTGAEPGASIIRVMAARCADKAMTPSLMWESRASNVWADDLSKGKLAGFCPTRRHRVDWRRYREIQEDYLMFSTEGRGKAQLRPPLPFVSL